jgi:hypothetical protein
LPPGATMCKRRRWRTTERLKAVDRN